MYRTKTTPFKFGSLYQINKFTLVQKRSAENYMIAIMRRIFLGSILECFLCLVRPSEASSAFAASLLGGAVTGNVGNALDHKGSKALRNL